MSDLSMCLDCKRRVACKRGCCDTCRNRQRRAILDGLTTEQELMATGRLLAARRSSWNRLWQPRSKA
jgi:hypothetical protein